MMAPTCDDLVPFVDGELDPLDAEEFREHLRTCKACQDSIPESMTLSTQLRSLREVMETPMPMATLPGAPPRTITEIKRHLHKLRREVDRIARRNGIPPGPEQLAAAIDALPDRTLLANLPEGYRKAIERDLANIVIRK